jgi:membrane protein DedA with SNARE-associated domain
MAANWVDANPFLPSRRPKIAMTVYALSLLFAAVLANQAGVPIPVVPYLVATGALAAHAGTGMLLTNVVVVGAALVADAIWYGLGRWHGRDALLVLARLLRRSATSVDGAEGRFRGHQVAFILGGRFLPELNPIAAGMAGATRMGPARYTLIAMTSALAWAFAWTGAGYAIGNIPSEALSSFGSMTPPFVIDALLAVGVWH